MNSTDERGIHDGHRSRMKDKLVTHGPRIFDTYELIEMLLYYAIPFRDTNPLAKRLLSAFGSVEGLFSATREELLAVSGVGEHTADLILTTAEMLYEGELSRSNRAEYIFDDYYNTGVYITDCFAENSEMTVLALLLDSGMRLVDRVEIVGTDFASGAMRSRPFIDAAMQSGATVAIFAHTRDKANLYPMPPDYETVKMLAQDLGAVGVRVAEHYLVAGMRFVGIGERLSIRFQNNNPVLEKFLRSRGSGER